MSKIAIISQPDQGVLIDVGGCETLQEATHHLTSTLQISSEFWKGTNVDLNLGQLVLNGEEVAQILSIAREVGVEPVQVFAEQKETQSALVANKVKIGTSSEQLNISLVAASEITNKIQTTQDPGPDSSDHTATASGAEVSKPQTSPGILYLRQTLRSGQAVSHQGHLVIIGDVNAGAEVIAEGDITVWGALRGVAHAGVNGNIQAEIRALRLQPIQLRIAHAIARSPDRPRARKSTSAGPETARIINGTIRIIANNPE